MSKEKVIEDHLKQPFSSVKEMCEHWGVSERLYCDRLSRGFSLDEALGQSKHSRLSKYTPEEIVDKFGVSIDAATRGLKNKWSLKEMRLYDRKNHALDHTGNIFKSVAEMCRYYKIDVQTYRNRLKKGLSTKDALTLPKHMKIKHNNSDNIDKQGEGDETRS